MLICTCSALQKQLQVVSFPQTSQCLPHRCYISSFLCKENQTLQSMNNSIMVVISNLYDSTFCTKKLECKKLIMKMSPICTKQILFWRAMTGLSHDQPAYNNLSYVNLQWLTNAEYNLYCVCGLPTVHFVICFCNWISLSRLTTPRQIQDTDFRSGSCFASVSELKTSQNSTENV